MTPEAIYQTVLRHRWLVDKGYVQPGELDDWLDLPVGCSARVLAEVARESEAKQISKT